MRKRGNKWRQAAECLPQCVKWTWNTQSLRNGSVLLLYLPQDSFPILPLLCQFRAWKPSNLPLVSRGHIPWPTMASWYCSQYLNFTQITTIVPDEGHRGHMIPSKWCVLQDKGWITCCLIFHYAFQNVCIIKLTNSYLLLNIFRLWAQVRETKNIVKHQLEKDDHIPSLCLSLPLLALRVLKSGQKWIPTKSWDIFRKLEALTHRFFPLLIIIATINLIVSVGCVCLQGGKQSWHRFPFWKQARKGKQFSQCLPAQLFASHPTWWTFKLFLFIW